MTETLASNFKVLDLFSGIGGFSLGLERAGMETVAFCEQDGYARRVLRKHWPNVWLYEDVRTLTAKRLRSDGLKPNVICGGFPCQDISTAGKGAGLEGARSGLWFEMLRLIKEVKPLWVIAENVPALRSRGADRVLADLEGAGYTAEPVVVGAWAVGGNHQRERVWLVAYSRSVRLDGSPVEGIAGTMARKADSQSIQGNQSSVLSLDSRKNLAHAKIANGIAYCAKRSGKASPRNGGWWATEPAVGRVADGIPARVDRLRCLGNAVVPLIPELIGRWIVEVSQCPPTS